jgi:hypothetical protein
MLWAKERGPTPSLLIVPTFGLTIKSIKELEGVSSRHGQSNCEMNYVLGNMNHKYETWGTHSCFSYLNEVYTNDKMFIL